MTRREQVTASCITHSIIHSSEKGPGIFTRIPNYFCLYCLDLQCVNQQLFQALRNGAWHLDETEFKASFGANDEHKRLLKAIKGHMGLSGSTFFTTQDEEYIIKSIPRRFESSFFKNDLLQPYAEYMYHNPNSLLTRITAFLACYQCSIGTLLNLAPTHHIVMENLLHGKRDDWEDYDLKPMSYFYPERDIAHGALSSEATKTKLADNFPDKLVLTLDQAEDLKAQLQKDTRLLANCNTVDYSLMLVRIPIPADPSSSSDNDAANPTSTNAGREEEEGNLPPRGKPPVIAPPSWRTSITSADGKWKYRASVLDFFWSKHKVYARVMTALISVYNTVDRQGHMSITTDSGEYRQRFLQMINDLIEVRA